MSDKVQSQPAEADPNAQKIDLKYFDISMLVDMYARAKKHNDVKKMRRINYEMGQRKKSIRKYSSTIKGLICRMDE